MPTLKVEGPRVRDHNPVIALLNNACFSMQKTPNAGTPEIIRKGLRAMQQQDPDRFAFAVRATARELQISVTEVLAIVNG